MTVNSNPHMAQFGPIESKGKPSRSGDLPVPGEQAPKPQVKAHSPADIQRLWEEGVQRRRRFDDEAWENIAFIAGDHYAIFDRVSNQFRRPPVDDGKVRMKVNLLKSLWRSQVSTITEGRPTAEVLPVSDEEADIKVAIAADRILDSELHRLEFEAIRSDLVMWTTSCGYAFLHPMWDPTTNNVDIEVIPQFEGVVDPAVRSSTRQARWFIHGRIMTKDEATEAFGPGHEFKEEAHNVAFSWEQMFGGSGPMKSKKGVLVLRMWYRPCRAYPEGFVRTVVGQEDVEPVRPFPYEHGELPFIDFHDIRIPGRFEGQAMVRDLIVPQKDYNDTRSRETEQRALAGVTKVLAPQGALEVDRITPVSGEVIEFRPVGPYKPEWMPHPNPPSFLFRSAELAFSEMQDIAGQHEVSRGSAPAGTPAAGILALQEKDERKVSETIRRMERGFARVGKQVLQLCQQYWDTQRTVRTWSEDTGRSTLQRFNHTDLKGEYDVRVVPGSGLPRSKAQERSDLLALWRERVITDPMALLKAMQLPNGDNIVRHFEVDVRQAFREHDRLFEEDIDTVAELWHNHDVHIAEHNNFRKTEEFEAWPLQAKAALADHVTQHEEYRLEKMAQAQEEMLLSQPLAGGGFEDDPALGGGIPGVNAPEETPMEFSPPEAV